MSRHDLGGGGAVRLGRARGPVAGEDPQRALHRALDFYPTPLWAGRAGAELILRLDPGPWWAWEPACGQGHLAAALGDYFDQVHATDVHDYGGPLQHGAPLDFCSAEAAQAAPEADWIITNPPFPRAAEFVELGLQRARRGVAILQRLTFLDTIGRYPLFFGERPLTVLAPFAERVGMTLGQWDPEASTATPYAWFVWLQPHVLEQRAPIRQLQGIAPGARRQLTKPDDARRFGRPRQQQRRKAA